MSAEKHLFDSLRRISAKEVKDLPMASWQPPAIDKAGHLVQAGRVEGAGQHQHNFRPGIAPSGMDGQLAEPGRNGARQDFRPGIMPDATGDGRAGYGQDAESRTGNRSEIESEEDRARREGFEQGRKEGLAAGMKQGVEQGRREGLSKGLQESKKQIDDKLGRLNALLTSLSHSLNEQDDELEQALLRLAQEVGRAVAKRELESDSGHIMRIVREAVNSLPPARDNLRLFVNAADLKLVSEAVEHGGENWRAYADEDVSPGGCRIETEQSLVDFTTEARFRSVVEQISRPEPAEIEDER